MRVISKAILRDFWNTVEGREAQTALLAWYKIADKADWRNFADVRITFGSADMVGNCVVFNICGNKFRLIAKIDYPSHRVFIGDVMTHKEYDKGLWKKDCNCFAAPKPGRQSTSEEQSP